MHALQSRDYDDALRLIAAQMKSAPADKRIWVLQGMAYAGKGEHPAALHSFRESLRLDAHYLPALEGAAQIEYEDRSPRAAALLHTILVDRPDDPTANAMLGFIEYRNKDCKASVANFERAQAALVQHADALGAYGYCLATMEQYERAIPEFRQALDLSPQSSQIRTDLALAQWKADRYGDAIDTLQPLLEGEQPSIAAQLLAANVYEANNDTPHAVELLRKAILANPKSADAYLEFAALAFDHESMTVGVDYLDAGIAQLPQEPRLYLARGVLHAELGKFHEATDDFVRANELDPHLSFAAVAEGLVASQEHRSSDALSSFRAAAKAHPDDALSQYLLAEALSEDAQAPGSGKYQEEVQAAQRATRIDPEMVAAHDLLATAYLRSGQTEQAIAECRTALKLEPSNQQALYHLVLALRKAGTRDEIPGLLKELTSLKSAPTAQSAQKKKYRLQEVPLDDSKP